MAFISTAEVPACILHATLQQQQYTAAAAGPVAAAAADIIEERIDPYKRLLFIFWQAALHFCAFFQVVVL